MNIFKAELDTIHQNGVIGPITQFDNATLELQILTGGQVGESWNSPEFELIAMKRDMNPVREVDQDKFTILSNEDHTVRIELKEQFLTCRGTVKMQLIVKDGSRSSTTIFRLSVGQSLDHDIITSIRDVEVLDQLDLYVAQGFSAINEATEITGELKKEMTEINNEASECEKERQASELTRNQRELVRVDNEEDRVANELGRIQNEEMRVANEEERVSSENTRITNENNRRTHENTRILQEAARQEAERQRNAIFEENESIRSEQENTRIKSENERKKKISAWEERETIRLKSEENRILQEQKRVENEENRKRQELTRQNQEEHRQRTYTQFNEAEASRIAKESQRESAEQQRQQSENERDANYQTRENKRDTEYGKAEEVRNNAFNQNEANRQNEYTVAERERVESEELRKVCERDRANAETKRQEAETARANAESGRVDRFNKEIEKVKTTMETATSNVNTAISQVDTTMKGIEQRADDCLPAIEKSASAKTDYMGNKHESIKDAMDANVEFVLDEVNTVHYEGQTITATDTIERQVRSAILKGNTLVNLLADKGEITLNSTHRIEMYDLPYILTKNKKYLLCLNVKSIDTPSGFGNVSTSLYSDDGSTTQLVFSTTEKGYHKSIFTTDDKDYTKQKLWVFVRNGETTQSIVDNIMLLEYQEGMENWDIPYFEGMQSVRMPVLTTTGKNLFDVETSKKGFYWSASETQYIDSEEDSYLSEKYIPVMEGDILIANNLAGSIQYMEYDSNKNFIQRSLGIHYAPYTVPKGVSLLRVSFYRAGVGSNCQIERGTKSTPFEPHKTNILSTSEDVTLGSVGNVHDTLDLLTGDVISRTGLYTYKGENEPYFNQSIGGYVVNVAANANVTLEAGIISDKFINRTFTNHDTGVYGNNNGSFYFFDKLTSSAQEFKEKYIGTNFRFELKEKSVKTVDLKGQKVYSYDGTTHYTCSAAEGSLVPTLSIDVPTNLPALVSRQRVTIESQKEQIITLEQENEQLIAQNEVQDTDIALNQDAINFMLFAPSVKSISEDKGGVSTMAAYLANQILKGRLDYTLVISRYSEFKEDIDTILISEGKQDLIK